MDDIPLWPKHSLVKTLRFHVLNIYFDTVLAPEFKSPKPPAFLVFDTKILHVDLFLISYVRTTFPVPTMTALSKMSIVLYLSNFGIVGLNFSSNVDYVGVCLCICVVLCRRISCDAPIPHPTTPIKQSNSYQNKTQKPGNPAFLGHFGLRNFKVTTW
jgi:hypothetical protein